MKLQKSFNTLMASAVTLSIAVSPVGYTTAAAQTAPAAIEPGESGWQKEFETWRVANKGGQADDYQTYLRLYPRGKFANVAKQRINELTATIETVSDTTTTAAVTDSKPVESGADKVKELELWRQVSKSGKQADYEKYLKAFPNGKFAKVAKTRIAGLVAKAAEPAAETTVAANDSAKQTQADEPAAMEEESTVTGAETPADNSSWEQEYAVWKAASDGNTIAEYESYLKTYPEGKFAAIAQARIVQLSAAETPDPTISEGDETQSDQATNADSQTADEPATDDNSQDTAAKTSGQDQEEAQQDQTTAGQDPSTDQADQSQADEQDQAQQDQSSDQDQAMAQDQAADQDQSSGQDQAQQEQPSDQDQAATDDDAARQGVTGTTSGDQPNQQQTAAYTEGSEDVENGLLDRQTRHELQGRLSSLGYDTRGTDGAFGPRTRDAIASWQQDNGAPVTGYLSEDQVNAIFAASAASYATWLSSQRPAYVRRVRPRSEWITVRPRQNYVVVRPRNNYVIVKRRPATVIVRPGAVIKFNLNNRVRVNKFRFKNRARVNSLDIQFNFKKKCRRNKRRC